MHPRLADLTDLLAERRAALLAAVAAVPAADLERRPTPDGWSVAEIVDHLARVEGGTARLLTKRVERARESGVGPDEGADPVRDRLAHVDVAGSPTTREAPEIVRPRPGVSAESALAALRDSREALLGTLREADGVDLSRVVATHAALGELDGYQWILFVAEHEARHARQIDVVREALADRPEGAGDTRAG